MATVLLTGATGLVGSAIARHLLERGDHVRALVRWQSDDRNIRGLDLELVSGDLRDARSLDVATKGCERVFHTAAKVAFWVPPRERAEFYAVNVTGTRNLLEAALRNGVERFVHTSTVSAIGVPREGGRTTEADHYSLWKSGTDYEHSKFAAEFEVARYAARGLPAVTVLPTAPLGWRDRTPNPVGQIVLDYLAGRLPRLRGGLNVVDVEDVAAGHLLAAEHGRPGERYIIGHADVTVDDLYGVLEAVSSIPAPKLLLPYPVGLAVGHVLLFVADRITRRPPMLTPSMVKLATSHYYASWEKARDELGYQPRSNPKLAAARAIHWFLENGYVGGSEDHRSAIRRSVEASLAAQAS